MLGVCILCQSYHDADCAICDECEALLVRMVAMYQNSVVEFSSLWQRFHSLGLYRMPLTTLINRGKYQEDLTILKTLARLLAKSLVQAGYERQATVMPVPMSHQRYLTRGYNQASVIAREVAKQLRLPFVDDIVVHTGKAAVQHRLSRPARKKNMQQAFEVVKKPPTKLCLVDDIFTTGATMQAICRALRHSGTEYLEIWIIAKTL